MIEAEPQQTPTRATAPALHLRAVALAILIFAICSICVAARSRGFLESDGGMHYIFARHAFAQPFYFVDVWGRPLCTALFALPATLGGLFAVRLTSLAMAIGCGLVAQRIAANQGYRRPELALIFTLGQPLVFLHSFSELTELPFALILGLALWAYQGRRWGAMAVLLAIAPLARPEGFVFLAMGAIALMAHRRWWPLIILPLGLIAWSFAGHRIVGPAENPWWRWVADHWPYESGSEYPPGNILHFFLRLPVLIGPFALPALGIGMWINLRPRGGVNQLLRDHRQRVNFIIAAIPLAVLCGHSLLFWRGKWSSNGEMRYLLVAAPMWGLLCARGWEWVFDRLNWRRAVSWAALAVVAPGLANYAWRVLPIEPSESWQAAQRAAMWYQGARGLREKYPRVLSNHPGIFYYLDLSPADRQFVLPWSADAIDHPAPGLMLFWDSSFCLENADGRYVVPLQRVKNAGWIPDRDAERNCQFEAAQHTADAWHLFRSPLPKP